VLHAILNSLVAVNFLFTYLIILTRHGLTPQFDIESNVAYLFSFRAFSLFDAPKLAMTTVTVHDVLCDVMGP